MKFVCLDTDGKTGQTFANKSSLARLRWTKAISIAFALSRIAATLRKDDKSGL